MTTVIDGGVCVCVCACVRTCGYSLFNFLTLLNKNPTVLGRSLKLGGPLLFWVMEPFGRCSLCS